MTALEKMKRYQSAFADLCKIKSLALDLKRNFQDDNCLRVYYDAENAITYFAKAFSETKFEDD